MIGAFTELYVIGDDRSERVAAQSVLIDELGRLDGISPPPYVFDPRDGKIRITFWLQDRQELTKVNRYLQSQLGDTLQDNPPCWLWVECPEPQSEGENAGRDALSAQAAAFLKSTMNLAWGKFKGSAQAFLVKQKDKAVKRIG